jgi:hypothetical protein
MKSARFWGYSSLAIPPRDDGDSAGRADAATGPRPAARPALGLVVALLVIAALAGLVGVTLAADDQRTRQAPWARRSPDVRPQPLDEQ